MSIWLKELKLKTPARWPGLCGLIARIGFPHRRSPSNVRFGTGIFSPEANHKLLNDTAIAALVGASLATTGWLYTARRARSLSRKQHTVNVMLQASFDADFREASSKIRPYLKAGNCPDDDLTKENDEVREAFRRVLNHYEFVAAGLRNGDFDENLVRDSERGAILLLFRACKQLIYKIRDDRSRLSIYEHLEWLNRRWDEKPPGRIQRCFEFVAGRPIPGRRHNPHE